MDATLKRRIWKVAIFYFVLSTLVFAAGFVSDHMGTVARFWTALFFHLQPLFWLMSDAFYAKQSAHSYLYQLPDWSKGTILILSVPIGSICFGWLYTKLVDRLNHFPALGRKIF